MTLNSAEVAVAVTGSIDSMPVDTVIEFDDIYTKPATAVNHGYASTDGIKITGSQTTTNITAWQNASNVRTVVTEASVTLQVTLLQSNDANSELFYGAKRNATTGAIHWDAARTGGRRSFIVDVIDETANKKFRYYIPSGEVTERGEISLVSGDAIGYNMTITAYKVDVAGEEANMLIWEGPATAPVTP